MAEGLRSLWMASRCSDVYTTLVCALRSDVDPPHGLLSKMEPRSPERGGARRPHTPSGWQTRHGSFCGDGCGVGTETTLGACHSTLCINSWALRGTK